MKPPKVPARHANRTGLHFLLTDAYHADPCPEPSLSASVAHILLTRSPLHAWHAHPKLNPKWQPCQPTEDMEEGSALHWLLLGAGTKPVVVDAPNWRTQAARDARDAARVEGAAPILAGRWRELRRCAAAVRSELRRTVDVPAGVGEGVAEGVLVWREPSGVWCRAMLDWIPLGADPPVPLLDFKATTQAASPEAFARRIADRGLDIQAAWYRRGFQAVFGQPAGPLVFVAAELAPPYGVTRFALGPVAEAEGEAKVERALELWARCLAEGDWPGYPRRIVSVEAPRFASLDWEAREARALQQSEDGSGRVLPLRSAAARRAANRAAIAASVDSIAKLGGQPIA